MKPQYLQLDTNTIQERIDSALQILSSCEVCPRICQVNRNAGETGLCKTARYAHLASYHLHFGEEPQLVGRRGSGTIFFAGCNLGCLFCQNYDISHYTKGYIQVLPEQLAKVMLELQEKGAHNINFVTPSHVVPQILESLPLAIEHGLNLPLVYNCGGYESLETLRMLDGIIDIYMPDIKFADPKIAEKYCNAPDYPEKAQNALKEMHRQVGDLETDPKGLASSGLLVRHLLMPDNLASTERWIDFISREISTDTCLHLMEQYFPAGNIQGYPELQQKVSLEEYRSALDLARKYKLTPLEIL